MIMTNLATVVRKKHKEQTEYVYDSCYNPEVLNKEEDFGKVVVMSGTARRKPLKPSEPQASENQNIINFNLECDDFLKLRAPQSTIRSKNACLEEKLMTKSCETLLECLKPYKDLTEKNATVWQSDQMTRSILKTNDFIYEKKATRKVQFLSFDENESNTDFDDIPPFQAIHENNEAYTLDSEDPLLSEIPQLKVISSPKTKRRKTISSQDFLNNAFLGNLE